jgi:hypothetical protein
MVKTAREASGPRALLPLNRPEPLHVEAKGGWPLALSSSGRRGRRQVTSIEDVWRVEEEWWRDTPIVRTYFEVLLDDGRRSTLFFDHTASSWFAQRYA